MIINSTEEKLKRYKTAMGEAVKYLSISITMLKALGLTYTASRLENFIQEVTNEGLV